MSKYSLLSNNPTLVTTAFINITTTFMSALGVTHYCLGAWWGPSAPTEKPHRRKKNMESSIFAMRNSPFSATALEESPLHTESTKNPIGESDLHPESATNERNWWLGSCWSSGVPGRTYPFVFVRAEESGVVPFLHHYECDARLIILLQFNASLPDSQQLVVENLSHTQREVGSAWAIAIIQIPLIYLQMSFIYPQIIYHVPSCTVTQSNEISKLSGPNLNFFPWWGQITSAGSWARRELLPCLFSSKHEVWTNNLHVKISLTTKYKWTFN